MNAVLSERRWLRFGAFTACYFAQGVPIGLVTLAIPARLVELGASVADLALFTMVVTLPWALKLIAGPFMDRFTFPTMGFRRPWVLLAQGGLTLSLLGLAFGDLQGPLIPLAIAGAVVNLFAATQDVAVDGMAIDLLHPDERGRANAFMAFGQVAGSSAYGALCSTLLLHAGLAAAALVCAITVAAIFVLVGLVRERPGERLMPWTPGQATPRAEVAKRRVLPIFRDLTKVLFLPMSLVLVAAEFVNRVRDGIAVAVFPAFAVQELGFTSEQYNYFNGMMGLGAALTGALLGTFMDRYGIKRFLLASLVIAALCHFAMGLLPDSWPNTTAVVTVACIAAASGQLVFVGFIALFMTLCWSRVAATQFAIYMSLANLSRSIGGGIFATVADDLTFAQDFIIMGVLLGGGALMLLLFNQDAHAQRLERIRA